jgi:hypothetical protein
MEWYDFFLFGTMTAIALAPLFFRPLEGHSKDSLYHRRASSCSRSPGTRRCPPAGS